MKLVPVCTCEKEVVDVDWDVATICTSYLGSARSFLSTGPNDDNLKVGYKWTEAEYRSEKYNVTLKAHFTSEEKVPKQIELIWKEV